MAGEEGKEEGGGGGRRQQSREDVNSFPFPPLSEKVLYNFFIYTTLDSRILKIVPVHVLPLNAQDCVSISLCPRTGAYPGVPSTRVAAGAAGHVAPGQAHEEAWKKCLSLHLQCE